MRLVQVLGRRLSPEAKPQAPSNASISGWVKSMSSTFVGRQLASPSHHSYGIFGLYWQTDVHTPVAASVIVDGRLIHVHSATFSSAAPRALFPAFLVGHTVT